MDVYVWLSVKSQQIVNVKKNKKIVISIHFQVIIVTVCPPESPFSALANARLK